MSPLWQARPLIWLLCVDFVTACATNAKKKGHLAKVCRSKAQAQPTPQAKPRTRRTTSNSQPVRQVDEESDTDSDDYMQPIMTVTKQRQDGCTPPIKVHIEVDKVSIPMEVDTGASVSIMSENQVVAREEPKYICYQIADLLKGAYYSSGWYG